MTALASAAPAAPLPASVAAGTPATSSAPTTEQVAAALSNYISIATQLIAVLQARQGAGGVVAGGANAAPAAVAPAPANAAAGQQHAGHDMAGMDMSGSAKGAKAKGGGEGEHAGHIAGAGTAHDHHGMDVIKRTAKVDRAKAQKYLDAVTKAFQGWDRNHGDMKFQDNGTHAVLSDAARKRFTKETGLEAPAALVFDKGAKDPIGVVFWSSKGKFDLGMGDMHKHAGHDDPMEHVWFTPGDLDFAYSDVAHGMTGEVAKMIKKAGARTGA